MNHVSQEALDRGIRIRQTQEGARSTMETRVALIIAERGLTKKQLAKFYVSRRKNSKPRFDYWAFAEAYGISKDWLYEGDLRSHPRGAAPRLHQPRTIADRVTERIVEKYGQLSPDQQRIVTEELNRMLAERPVPA